MHTEQADPAGVIELRLYVADRTRKSVRAFANLRRICDQHLPGQCRIEVIDILEQPETARREQIVAIPTVVRRRPLPMRTVIGDLSDAARALDGLELLAIQQGANV